ncbi:Glycosyltransferase RgtA/B/C/D-like domain-containing protein [Microcystis aeruginosa]
MMKKINYIYLALFVGIFLLIIALNLDNFSLVKNFILDPIDNQSSKSILWKIITRINLAKKSVATERMWYLALLGGIKSTLVLCSFLLISIPISYKISSLILEKKEGLKKPQINSNAVILSMLIGLSFFLWSFITSVGNRQFGSGDMGIIVDVGWRLYNGQIPYRDFICTVPPSFYLGAKYAFDLFGVSWVSILKITALYSIITFVWSYFLLIRIFRQPYVAIIVAFCCQSLTLLFCSFWWYNPVTTITFAIYLFSTVLICRNQFSWFTILSYILSLFLMFTMKANIAGLAILAFSIILFSSRRHRLFVVASTLSAILILVVFLHFNHLTLPDIISGSLAVSKRGVNLAAGWKDISPIEKTGALLLFAAALLPLVLNNPISISLKLVKPSNCLFSGHVKLPMSLEGYVLLLSGFIGLYGWFSNSEPKIVDFLPIWLSVSIPILSNISEHTFSENEEDKSLGKNYVIIKIVLCIFLLLIVSGLTLGGLRHRVEKIGYGYYFEWDTTANYVKVKNNKFFENMIVSERFATALDEIQDFLNSHPNSRVYFGGRFDFGWAAYGIQSPKYLPLFWHSGYGFPEEKEDELTDTFNQYDYQYLIYPQCQGCPFFNQFVNLSEKRVNLLMNNYSQDKTSYSSISILSKKTDMEGK